MDLETETILTLNDEITVKILSELEYETRNYYFCVRLDANENETNNYEIFEHLIVENTEKLIKVTDQSLMEQLLVLFTGQYTEYVDEVAN